MYDRTPSAITPKPTPLPLYDLEYNEAKHSKLLNPCTIFSMPHKHNRDMLIDDESGHRGRRHPCLFTWKLKELTFSGSEMEIFVVFFFVLCVAPRMFFVQFLFWSMIFCWLCWSLVCFFKLPLVCVVIFIIIYLHNVIHMLHCTCTICSRIIMHSTTSKIWFKHTFIQSSSVISTNLTMVQTHTYSDFQ